MGGAKTAIGPVTALISPQREQIGDSRRVGGRRSFAAMAPGCLASKGQREGFAPDSPLEEDGFEPSVPERKRTFETASCNL
jgi:hypothetical protein